MYPATRCDDFIGRIVGMLLFESELYNNELLAMLENRESLKAIVEEAVAMLQTHQANGHQ